MRVATVAGVPVLLSASWLVIAVAVTVLFGPVAARATGLPVPAAYLVAVVLAVLLAASVLVHEAAHAVAARRAGLHVEEVVVDLWGGHTSLGRPATPGTSAVVSVVGPLANLVLAGVASAARALVPAAPADDVVSVAAVVGFLLAAVALVNLVLGLFNLVPGLPLDGGRVLEALVWRVSGSQDTGAVVAGWAGRAVAVALVAWGVGRPLLLGAPPSLFTVVWVVVLAGFLWQGASASLTVARFRRRAAEVDLAAVARAAVAVPATASVADVVAAQGGAEPREVVLVDPLGRPVAVVPGGSVTDVPLHLRPSTPAAAVGLHVAPASVVPARLGAVATVEALARSGGAGVVLVDDTGRPTARVLPDDFAAAMGLR